MELLDATIEIVGSAIEAGGVLVILVGALVAAGSYIRNVRRDGTERAYVNFRIGLARSILLGLELLVAGDIIRTVVVDPSLQNVIVLGLIVLIRTFLSFALEMEVTGRWPWNRAETEEAKHRPV